jgi:hypothetical protein
MMPEDPPTTTKDFPPAARGRFVDGATPDPDVQDHMAGFNNAIDEALRLGFASRESNRTYQVTVHLSATVREGTNPGRISEYIATVV